MRERHDVNNIRDLEGALQAEWVRIPLQVIRKLVGLTLMRVIGDTNHISEDVFDFMISYLPFSQKSIRSELALNVLVW